MNKNSLHYFSVAGAFIAALIVTYLLASVSHSQVVLAELAALGIDIAPIDRIRMTWGDLLGLYNYALIIALGLALAFAMMGLLNKLWPINAWIRFPLSGALAMLALLLLMKSLLLITPIAGARGTGGLFLQCLAGFIGGFVFVWVRRWRTTSD